MPKKVLVVEDDGPRQRAYIDNIQEKTDLEVFGAGSITEALSLLSSHPDTAVAVIDLMLNPKEGERKMIRAEDSRLDGHALAQHLRTTAYPSLKSLAITSRMDKVNPECKKFFKESGDPSHAVGVYDKNSEWVLLRHHVMRLTSQPTIVRVFIVHGHDHSLRDEAKVFCEKTLGWAAEVLEAETGTTWIEKFEEHANEASLAWVLATDDEWGAPRNLAAPAERRPRPNVILEYGYFLGKFGRRSHRVFLFTRPAVMLGSDIDGVAHINVPQNFSAEVEADIRKHHRVWLLP